MFSRGDHLKTEYKRIKEGKTFSCRYSKGAAGGNYPHLHLWNPQNSSVNFFIKKIFLTQVSVSGTAYYGRRGSALGTLGDYGANHFAGQSNSAHGVHHDATASVGISKYFGNARMEAEKRIELLDGECVIVPPDEGFMISGSPASTIYATFVWEEVPV